MGESDRDQSSNGNGEGRESPIGVAPSPSRRSVDRRRAAEAERERLRIEARERAAEAEAERARFRTIFESAPHGIVFCDALTGQVIANSAAVRLLGRPPVSEAGIAQFVGWIRRRSGRSLALEELPIDRALHGRAVPDQELVLARPDGTQVPVLAGAAPVRSRRGKVAGAVVIFQDISTLKELERQREEWISVIAHDMRQPVTVIKGYVGILHRLLQRHPSSKEIKALDQIGAATENLGRIIGDLLEISRLEAKRLKLRREPVDLSRLVQEVVGRTAPVTAGHQVRVHVEGTIPAVWADPGRVEQVLGNLLSNAAKYSYPDSEILVEVLPREGAAQVSVTNRGEGIPPDELPDLFSRFHRTRWAEKEPIPGLGLGLYISKGLVEAHGGRLWAESTPGESATFRFTLPMAEGQHRALADTQARRR